MRFYTLIVLASFISLGSATVVKQVSFEDLVASSDRIVSGHVTKSWSSWGSQHKFIWTRYEVAVDHVMLGSPLKTLVVSEPGGILDGKAMSIESAVRYTVGEHVALFLKQFPSGDLRTVGWSQGKFTIDEVSRIHNSAGAGFLADGRSQGTPIHSLEGITYRELSQRVGILSPRKVAQ